MSRAVKPTYKQKKIIRGKDLDERNWLVVKETETELKIVNKGSGSTRTIKKLA